ncbi:MAG: glycerol-3-phosphate responsive antiterminator [Clostridia bacterium]|nr:glycerol-3-phosphate responsive antiterminator [Clostridia bacterium]
MEHERILDHIESHPVIAAVRHEEDLAHALCSQVQTVFLLQADIFNVQPMVDRIHSAGKTAFIHMDFLEGLGRDQKAIDYLHETVQADGIISTKTNHIKHAKGRGLFAIQRFFLVDSLSYETAVKTVEAAGPDMVEVMPGVMPRIIRRLAEQLRMPVIAGGLVTSKDEVIEILKAGAMGVSTARKELWSL